MQTNRPLVTVSSTVIILQKHTPHVFLGSVAVYKEQILNCESLAYRYSPVDVWWSCLALSAHPGAALCFSA